VRHFDKQGQPLTYEEYGALLTDSKYKRVAETTCGAYWVSTVWLGSDHSFSTDAEPVIFETMVQHMGSGKWPYQERYCTEAEALAGHARAVALYSMSESQREALERLLGQAPDPDRSL
jgi:hypothetical protein